MGFKLREMDGKREKLGSEFSRLQTQNHPAGNPQRSSAARITFY